MVTDQELLLGGRALSDLHGHTGDFILHGDNIEEGISSSRPVGGVAVMATEFSGQGDDIAMSVTNRAVFIDRDSIEDQKQLMSAYRQYIGEYQKKFPPLEDDDIATEAAKAGIELSKDRIATLAGFLLIEYDSGGNRLYSGNIFCAIKLAQHLTLVMRQDLIEVESAIKESEPQNSAEERAKQLLITGTDAAKVMDPAAVLTNGVLYAINYLPTPKELRKQLGYAPPRKNK